MQWGYGFQVLVGQDRTQRYSDATLNNPSINPTTVSEAEAARDQAFAYIDAHSTPLPYQIYCNGNTVDEFNDTYQLSISVRAVPGF